MDDLRPVFETGEGSSLLRFPIVFSTFGGFRCRMCAFLASGSELEPEVGAGGLGACVCHREGVSGPYSKSWSISVPCTWVSAGVCVCVCVCVHLSVCVCVHPSVCVCVCLSWLEDQGASGCSSLLLSLWLAALGLRRGQLWVSLSLSLSLSLPPTLSSPLFLFLSPLFPTFLSVSLAQYISLSLSLSFRLRQQQLQPQAERAASLLQSSRNDN